jgi:long-chain acyl-CoA synthetase
VVGVPSDAWGETPVAFVAMKAGATADAEAIKTFVNGQVGKTQRVADVQIVDSLPRSHIGKVLKRELRDSWQQSSKPRSSTLKCPPNALPVDFFVRDRAPH